MWDTFTRYDSGLEVYDSGKSTYPLKFKKLYKKVSNEFGYESISFSKGYTSEEILNQHIKNGRINVFELPTDLASRLEINFV